MVDLTRILAGPFCTGMLADMGADVVKVETPGIGDPLRAQGAIRNGLSWYFAGFNRNKRSLSLNLRSEAGRAVLSRLIAQSDVLVENFRPGVLAQMGFDETRLRQLKPDLVYCNISGFGTTGPYRDRPSFDFIAQAMSGFMAVTGMPDGPPLRAGPPIADLVAGLHGALGICAALVKRSNTGHGETVGAAIEARLVTETTEYWIDKLNAAGVPAGRVMGLAEVFADPQIIDQEMVLSQDHPGHGTVRMLGFPIKFAEAPCALRRPTPEVGADTDAVLQEIGYSAAEIASFRQGGVV